MVDMRHESVGVRVDEEVAKEGDELDGAAGGAQEGAAERQPLRFAAPAEQRSDVPRKGLGARRGGGGAE